MKKGITMGELMAITQYIKPIEDPQERKATVQSLFDKLSRYDVSESQKEICGDLKEQFGKANND
jgi:hypothetical protein